ncbi:MAG: SpoIIE family protein phosphatase [Candidatus Latescibacteria bacterium]|nr:SpoIIE family protein phosphatase [Candidatus Latescibacterota bacterium]
MEKRTLILGGRVGDLDVRFELGEGVHVAGRAADCDILLSESSISRRHAEIEFRDGRARLRDLGSHNGTQVNGNPVDGWRQLEFGDKLTLGRATLTVGGKQDTGALMTFVGDRPSTGVAITWHEVTGRDRSERLAPRSGGKRAELFTVLAEAGSLLVSPGAPEDLFEPILDLVDAAMAPERALIVLLDENDGEPQVRASRVRGGGAADNIMLSRTVIERVLGERVSFLIEDAQRDAALQAQMSIVSQGLHTAMAAPLFDNQSVIGLLYADSADTADRYTTDELKAFTLLANCIAVALTHARYHTMEAEKQRLDTELGAARRIMATLLPAESPAVPGWELLTHLESCTEVGGDLYDVFPLPDGRLAVVIGDVAGKGLGAALLVSSLLPLLRGLAGSIADLSDLVHRLNAVLFAATEPIRYATLFVGLLDPATGELAYVNAGHNPPFVVRGDGTTFTLTGTGLPVALMDDGVWKSGTASLAAGDLLALYTDGIPEAWNAADEDYGDERLRDLLASLRGRPTAEVRDAVLADVKSFVGEAPTSDDVTLVLLRRLP